MKVIIDFDGTLTAEETQARPLADKSLDTLAHEIVGAPRQELAAAYESTQAHLLQAPHRYWWEVNGLIASYCDEGAFILNTTTLQVMLSENEAYLQAVTAAFPEAEYDPVVDCTNYLSSHAGINGVRRFFCDRSYRTFYISEKPLENYRNF